MRLSIRLPKLPKRFLILLAILGPGIITAIAGNDAGGITTYSVAGAHFGFSTLWVLFLVIIALGIVQEMCVRMGVVTGKGLSDLIRENFGLKVTLLAMIVLLIANVAVTISEFAGIAASLEIFGITKYISVPLMALIIWLLIIRGSYRGIERVFLGLCLIFVSYIISGILVRPDWGLIAKETFIPSFRFAPRYILILIGIAGTTVTPWMQFFAQSSTVDKGTTLRQYKYRRIDVLVGALVAGIVAFFIIVCCAATLHKLGIRVEEAKEVALALQPLAGNYCGILFAIGLFGASTLGAAILPLSSSYAICEAFGWENGLNKRFREAPIFFSLYTVLILVGASAVLIPKISLVGIMLFSQEVNGILLPIILIFILLLVNNKRLMGEHTNSRIYNIIVWVTIGGIIILAGIFLLTSFLPGGFSERILSYL